MYFVNVTIGIEKINGKYYKCLYKNYYFCLFVYSFYYTIFISNSISCFTAYFLQNCKLLGYFLKLNLTIADAIFMSYYIMQFGTRL